MYFFIFRYVGGLWYDDGEFVHSEILNWEKSVCGEVWEGVSSTEDQDEEVCSGVNNTQVQPRINNSSNKFLGKFQGIGHFRADMKSNSPNQFGPLGVPLNLGNSQKERVFFNFFPYNKLL